jgi:hypothetical protein
LPQCSILCGKDAALTGFARFAAQDLQHKGQAIRTKGKARIPTTGACTETIAAASGPERQTMIEKVLPLSLVLAGLICAPAAAQSMGQCAQRDLVLGQLAERYGETRRGMGIAANNSVMEMFAAADTGTWTITVTMPNGMTCLVASGQGFEAMADELPAKGSPA